MEKEGLLCNESWTSEGEIRRSDGPNPATKATFPFFSAQPQPAAVSLREGSYYNDLFVF